MINRALKTAVKHTRVGQVSFNFDKVQSAIRAN